MEMRILLAVVLLAGCDFEGMDQGHHWDERPPLVLAGGDQPVDAEPLDFSEVTPKPTRALPPPPKPSGPSCQDGFRRIVCTPTHMLCCQKSPGVPWPADPCAPLELVATSDDLIACQ